MTRQEVSHTRDLTFSGWIRDKLPDSSSGFMVSDIDFYLFNYKTKKHAIVEVKTNNSQLKRWQMIMYNNLSKWLKSGGEKDGWIFCGFYIIQFENNNFDDGKVYLNEKEIDETGLIEILSLR